MKNFKYYFIFILSFIFLKTEVSQALSSNPGSDNANPDQQRRNAVQPVNNPSFTLMDLFAAIMGDSGQLGRLSDNMEVRGIQFKNPIVSPGMQYRWVDDNAPGGFAGDEISGNVAFDADIYDGLITGVLYQHTYRGARNALATSEHLDSDAVSLYGAKRFFNLLNVGLSYNYSDTEHRLTRTIQSNLDRDSHGFSAFAGISDRKGKWTWATTTSLGYAYDDYTNQTDLETARFGWGGSLGYDICKSFTFAGAFNYYNFVVQDTFANTAARDDDYYTIGPRFIFYPNDNLVVRLDFDSMQGYTDLASYALRLGVDIGF